MLRAASVYSVVGRNTPGPRPEVAMKDIVLNGETLLYVQKRAAEKVLSQTAFRVCMACSSTAKLKLR